MNVKQRLLKTLYPALMSAGKWFGMKAGVEMNKSNVTPIVFFYDLKAIANNGRHLCFSDFRGKKVLIVNTASECGYTAQFSELSKLSGLYKSRLIIIGFPSNDFAEQEKGSDEEIAVFCSVTFGIQFPLTRKSSVIKGSEQHEVYKWLTDKNKNGWNDKQPEWNFSKYLINEQGTLTHYFGPGISPLDYAIIKNFE